MKIAIASLGDPKSVRTWSGTSYHIISALEQNGHDVIPIHLFNPKEPWYFDWLRRVYFRAQKKWFLASVEITILKKIGKQLDNEVLKINPEVVIVIHGDWLAYTSFPQPSCIIHDATFATLVDYYPAFTNLTVRSVNGGNAMYRRALQRADLAVFSAAWASNSAVDHYQIPRSKVHTIPFGANISEIPKIEEVAGWIERRSKAEICKFLFIGVDWERKGGPDALKFVVHLNKLGIKSRLIIVGCSPDIAPENKDVVEEIGFLQKDVTTESSALNKLLEQCQALLLPSLAECYGCVYCEANAYGLPVLGRDTGGVSEIIKDGVNGLLMKVGETAESFADRWINVWKQRAIYLAISEKSRLEYDERLNYHSFVAKLEPLFKKLVKK